jgi:hypothetical protein
MRGPRHRGCVVLASNLEWNPARARPRDAAEDILRPESKQQLAAQVPGVPILRPIMPDFAYGGSRARWSGRFSTGGCRLPYCASHAFLHSCPHRNLRCTLQHFNAERRLESARPSPNRVRQVLGSIAGSLLAIQIALQFSESPHARCPHARIRLHLQRLQEVL